MTQKNLREAKPTKKSGLLGVGIDIDEIVKLMEQEARNIRRPITLEPLENLHGLKLKYGEYHGKRIRFTKVLGAAGENNIPEVKLKVMSDPHDIETRKFFSNAALTDPVLAPALDRRSESLFEDGFELKLKLASEFDPTSGQQLNPEQVQLRVAAESSNYNKFLQLLSTWKDDMNILQLMRDLESVSFVQGKAAALVSPGLMDLQQGKLPFLVEIITAEDLAEPIVDVGMTRQLVGVKLNLEDKKIARADELIYVTRGKRGLRREAKFHGASALEPLFFISKIIKRVYNFDFSEAVVAAYITKLLFFVKSEGDETEQKTKVDNFLKEFFKAGKLAFAMTDDIDHVDQVAVKVDWPMLDGVEKKLADVEIAQSGVPKSMLNREHNLNRDIATIQAIQFVRFVRKPAERLVAEALENQLFNPLFAKLVGKPLAEIPVRIEVIRKTPQEGDIDVIYDKLSEQKNEEINSQSMAQPGTTTPFGASGKDWIPIFEKKPEEAQKPSKYKVSHKGKEYHVSTE